MDKHTYTKLDFQQEVIYQCVDCGAYAAEPQEVKHFEYCTIGESRKWEVAYNEADKDDYPYGNEYPGPGKNPECKCYPNMIAAHFCSYGHMTECHYPMTCREAECAHWEIEQDNDNDDWPMFEDEV